MSFNFHLNVVFEKIANLAPIKKLVAIFETNKAYFNSLRISEKGMPKICVTPTQVEDLIEEV